MRQKIPFARGSTRSACAATLQLKGTSYEGRYVIVDIELESDRPTERLAYFDPSSNPGSTVLVHKQPDNVWRIEPLGFPGHIAMLVSGLS
ncbi:hypothetical protein [Paraburkholderia sp. DGU8]|uniref:hypothetical protein n=1 Tax=Paraburkholderia sp. DGU8 TaxID=3161997 RepID=UPI0034669408